MIDTKNNAEWTPPTFHVQAATPDTRQLAAEALKTLHCHDDTRHSVLVPEPDHFDDDVHRGKVRSRTACAHRNTWRLVVGGELPVLHRPDGVSWSIDFRSARTQRRATETNRAQQPLARALGISKLSADERSRWHILDGTAGAGTDGWQLAAAGANITWVEQHPVLYLMLRDALVAASNTAATQAIAGRIQVKNQRIEEALLAPSPTSQADALYLDPMYPTRRSSAAVKKPMQFIQALVGHGPDPESMVLRCLAVMKQGASKRGNSESGAFIDRNLKQDTEMRGTLKRVVVKRPSEAPPLISASDAQLQLVSINAGAARFDVYLKPYEDEPGRHD